MSLSLDKNQEEVIAGIHMERFIDLQFRQDLYEANTFSDGDYNRGIRFGHLIYCLRQSFIRAITPGSQYTDNEFRMIMKWLMGHGYEFGIKSMLTLPNPKAEDPTDPRTRLRLKGEEVTVGKAKGHIDLIYRGLPYELKCSLAVTKKGFKVYSNMIIQLAFYCAAKRSNEGVLKLWNPILQMEKTYKMTLSDDQIKRFRRAIIRRARQLHRAINGKIHWSALPIAFMPYKCRKCKTDKGNGCEWLEHYLPDNLRPYRIKVKTKGRKRKL